jgi:hypothetical protein
MFNIEQPPARYRRVSIVFFLNFCVFRMIKRPVQAQIHHNTISSGYQEKNKQYLASLQIVYGLVKRRSLPRLRLLHNREM